MDTPLRQAALLQPLVGRTIAHVRRVLYEFRGVIDDSAGPVEIVTDDGLVFHLRGGHDGARLVVHRTSWDDPFADPLTPENHKYVDEFGKWTIIDLTDRLPYSRVVGKKVSDVLAIALSDGTHAGAVLLTDTTYICAFVDSDEFIVNVIRNPSRSDGV